MSFQPIIAGSGLVAWRFLKSTQATQQAAFDKSAAIARDADYFLEKIGGVRTAEDLVSNRRLLNVALGAFGLQDDTDNRYFIQKILADGTTAPDALANKMSDERYKAFSRAFGFDLPLGANTTLNSFGPDIVSRYRTQQFEIAVGDQDGTLRFALNFEREVPELVSSGGSEDTLWFRLMGTTPLRSVLETALGLPSSFGQLDIDKQLEMFRDKMQARFGITEVAEMQDADVMDDIVQTYLLRSQIAESANYGSAQVALGLLKAIPRTSLLG